MPEGPSIVILREEAAHLVGMKVTRIEGNTRIDTSRMQDRTIEALRSWGKHFLIDFGDFALRVHLMLFGRYRVDERREGVVPRLSLGGKQGELNLYACSVRYIDEPLDAVYDWRVDVMSDQWSPALARKKMRAQPDVLACDALLDQNLFAGVGNIIKNEVLYRIRAHPLSTLGALPDVKRNALVREARNYAFEFLEWKKAFVLRKHWLVHQRSLCPIGHKLTLKTLGTTQRRTFFCPQCQVLYAAAAAKRPAAKRAARTTPARSA